MTRARILFLSLSRADHNYQRPVQEALKGADWCEAWWGKYWTRPCSTAQEVSREAARALRELAGLIDRESFDLVVLTGDRWDAAAAAMACTIAGVPIAHIAGGALTTGSYDDVFRNQISRAATLHFPLCEDDAQRLATSGPGMSEWVPPESFPAMGIYVCGSPALDMAAKAVRWANKTRKGREDCLVAAYPETATGVDVSGLMEFALAPLALKEEIWLTNNPDVGAKPEGRTMAPEEYYRRLATARVCVGNSSSFVLEAPFFGTPVVLVGDRQMGRHLCSNIIQVPNDPQAIREAVDRQLEHGPYEPDLFWGDGASAVKIANHIHTWWERRP